MCSVNPRLLVWCLIGSAIKLVEGATLPKGRLFAKSLLEEEAMQACLGVLSSRYYPSIRLSCLICFLFFIKK